MEPSLKRFLIILALVLFAPMARATATFDAEYGRYAKSGTGTSDSLTVSNTIAAGKALMIPVVNEASSKNITSISDTRGNTFTKIGITNVSSVHNIEFWYCLVTTTIQVSDTITVNWSSSENTDRGFILWGFNGIVSSSAIDVSLTTRATFGSTVDKSITTTVAGDACAYAVVIQGNKAYTPAGGTTQIGAQLLVGYVPASTVGLLLTTGYQIQTSTGSFSPAGSIVPDDTALVILVSFKPVVTHTYYVDYVGGSDGAAGTGTGTAWKHCPGDTNATSTASTTALVAGDTVIFKGGVSYVGDIAVKVSGSSGLPITYDGTGASFGTGRAIIDCNNTYYCAFDCISPNQKSYFTIKGFEIKNCKNSNNASNQSITRAGSDLTGINYGGNNDIYSEGGLQFNGVSNVYLDGLWLHDFENCYDLCQLGAETDADPQTSFNVLCVKSGIEFLAVGSVCDTITITNCQLWAIGRNAIKLFGVSNGLITDCDIGGTTSAGATTNKGWFAVGVKLSSNSSAQPCKNITVQRTLMHDGWQYQGDESQQRAHAGDWMHLFGDADGTLEPNDDCHDILFDRVYCYSDHTFVNFNGTSYVFIESDVYNVEFRNCLFVNGFSGDIEMRDCSNVVANACTFVDIAGQVPINLKAGVHFDPLATVLKNNAYYTTSANSANVPCGTSSTFSSSVSSAIAYSDYNRYYSPNNGGNSWSWNNANKTLSAWQTFSSLDAHSTYGTLGLTSIPANGSTSSSGDYTPANGSALIDAGVTIAAFSTDYNGTSRPIGSAWEIGAFETSNSGGGGGGSTTASQFSGGLTFRGGVIFR